MNRIFAAAVAAAVAVAAPLSAGADMIALSAPLASASLHKGGIDMNVYYTTQDDNGFEVVATYAPAATPAEAARLRMRLADGDAVHFALPGHEATIYTFERSGATVAVSAEQADAPERIGS